MRDLGYVYHRGAASLRAQSSATLGLMVTDLSNPFFAEMAVGFEEALDDDAALTLVSNTFDRPTRQAALVRSMRERGVDGLVYVPVETDTGPAPVELAGMPVLAVTRRPQPNVAYLGSDDAAGGRLAAEHLLHHGSERFVYLGGPRHGSVRRVRFAAVMDRVQAAGAVLVGDLDGRTSVETGYRLGQTLLEQGTEFDAVICHSDVVAFGLFRAMRDRGFDPGSVRIVGFDGLAMGAVSEPSLTTVSGHPADIGHRAAAIVREMQPGDVFEDLVAPELIIRSSCGCR
jgi:LacI family transcriptional regulator